MANKTHAVDFAGITENQKETWATGDFNEIARLNVGMAEELVKDTDPHAGERVLDVACGSGTAALVAARRYCEVVGIDYVSDLIDRAEVRSIAEGLQAEFQVADAQNLPFADNSFDVVLSVYGVQFAPDQEKAASEMLRVCRRGGKIGLASPMPEGWSGDFFAVHGEYTPPPPDINSPLRWGTEEGLADLFGDGVQSIRNTPKTALQYYRSVDHAVEVFSTHFGPTLRALESLHESRHDQLLDDMRTVFARYNRASDGTAIVENRYLHTVVTCK